MILNLCCWASPQKFPPGKRFHSLCCGLLNVCIGKSHCSLHCWLERTKVSPMQPLSKLSFSLFKVCHVLRWLLVHTIHRSTAPSKVKFEPDYVFSAVLFSSALTFSMPPLPSLVQVDRYSGVPRFVKIHAFTLDSHFSSLRIWHRNSSPHRNFDAVSYPP